MSYLDPIDIIRQYDEALVDFLSLPVNIGKDIRWTKKDLLEMSVGSLVEICQRRSLMHEEGDRTFPKATLITIILNYQRVPVVFASPSPQYAVRPWLLTGKPEAYRTKRIPFPIMTLSRLSVEQDNERFTNVLARKLAWSHDGREVAQSLRPLPMNYNYQLDVLATKVSQMNQIDQYLLRVFEGPRFAWMQVNHGNPWGVLSVFLDTSAGYTEDGQLEAPSDAEESEKLLRHTWTLIINGWLPQQVNMRRTVLKHRTSVVDMQHPEVAFFEKDEDLRDQTTEIRSAFLEEAFTEEEFLE